MSSSVGEQLKKARIDRGLSLEQAAQATRIRKFYLEALESDQRINLPSPVQGKGFLRLYASYLDLDIDSLLALWDGKVQPEIQISEDSKVSSPDKEESAIVDIPPERINDQDILSPVEIDETELNRDSVEGSNKIFSEIGIELKEQRVSLGLSQAEVERYTRLRQHYIQAMEDGKLENMPSPVQARGMLSNYAAFLNLNEEKIMLRFAEGLQKRRVERIPKVQVVSDQPGKKKPARQAPFWRRFITPDLAFGIGLAIIILFFIVWTAARIDRIQNEAIEPTTPAIAEVLLTPDSQQSTDVQPEVTEASTLTTEQFEAITPEIDIATLETAFEISTAPQVVDPDFSQQVTPTLPPMNDDPLQVYIVAQQRAWLRVIADDKVKFLGRLVPGNAYAFSGERRIELLTGNAAGLQVFFNQNDLGIIGIVGEVAGLVFTSEGVATATPAIQPTHTPFAQQTITQLPTPTSPATPSVTPFIP